MDIKKELDELMDDPLLELTDVEKSLFDVPKDMRKNTQKRKQPEFYARQKPCKDFNSYKAGFEKVSAELKNGERSLVRVRATDSMKVGNYYVVNGMLVYLEKVLEYVEAANGTRDGRTRCIYDNGTESSILLQTLRKNVVESGFAITNLTGDELKSFSENKVEEGDKTTGYIYVLRSLSADPKIANIKDLYKIGFTEGTVEQRIADAANDPTYLMSAVKVVASYKIVNMNSHKFETLVHRTLNSAQMQISVTDACGVVHNPKEWFVVPLQVVDTIVKRITDGSIVDYTYNAQLGCLVKCERKSVAAYDTTGMKILTLNIKKKYFDMIINGSKDIEYRELKQSNMNKYTYVDKSDGKRYLRRYDALRLYVGYHKDRENALVRVVDTAYDNGIIEYHLGEILETNK